MFKKLASILIVLASGLVIPASVSASWQFEEEPIPGDAFEMHGNIKFASGILGNIDCTVQVGVTLIPGTTTAESGQFEVEGLPTEECEAGGFLASCVVHDVTYLGLPLILHATEAMPPTLSITTGDVQYTITGGFCAAAGATVTTTTLTATPDNGNAMKTVTLSGAPTVHLSDKSGKVFREGETTLSGDLKVTPEGIYGI